MHGYCMKGKIVKALICLLLFVLFEANASPSDKDNDWNARLEYARLLSYSKKYAESETEYRKLLKEKPHSILVKIELAKIYSYQNKSKELEIIIKSIPKEEFSSEAELLLADMYVAKKEFAEAEKLYLKNLDAS